MVRVLAAIFVFLIATARAVEITDDILEQLAELDYHALPREVRDTLLNFRRRRDIIEVGDNSNWCCINGTPPKKVSKTRVKLENIPASELIKTGYANCGTLGAERCSMYEMKYRLQVKYSTEFVVVEDFSECPDEGGKLVCCDGFLPVANNCFSKAEITNPDFVKTLNSLKAAGLIV